VFKCHYTIPSKYEADIIAWTISQTNAATNLRCGEILTIVDFTENLELSE